MMRPSAKTFSCAEAGVAVSNKSRLITAAVRIDVEMGRLIVIIYFLVFKDQRINGMRRVTKLGQLVEVSHLTLHGLEMGVVLLLDPDRISHVVVIFVEMEKERIHLPSIADGQVKGLEI